VKQADITAGQGLVNFELKPGGTIRVRILDEQGRPAARGTVYLQGWRGNFDYLQFDRAPREADVDGVWEWNEAPAGELTASIGRQHGMTLNNRTLTARKEEYVFRVPPELVISGKVVDAETKQPIKSFRAVRGYRWREDQRAYWDTNSKLQATDGRYEMRQNFEQATFLVRIEADGYLHAVSREVKSNEGNVPIDFELIGGKDITGTVLAPDGRPAAGAKVGLVPAESGVVIHRGEIENLRGRDDLQETDETGKFRVTAKNDDFTLVITHHSGYVELTGLPASPRAIKLTPWSRIEGTFLARGKPLADVEITLNDTVFIGRNRAPNSQESQTTDLHGRFVFDRVLPGKRRLSAKRTTGRGESEISSSVSIAVDCPPGQTAHVDLGTTGRPVIGQLRRPSESKPEAEWKSAQIYIGQAKQQTSPEAQLFFQATPDHEGNFAIEDLPPGDYWLTAVLEGAQNLMHSRSFTVPNVNEKLSQRPVDLGVLTLALPERRRAGAKVAPAKAAR
jgi:hypothetical protein